MILLLGGTIEARKLTSEIHANIIYSLAGRTEDPIPLNGVSVRRGGFGGVDGLARFLEKTAIEAVIDATHPYAMRMGQNAIAACAMTGTPLIRLLRAPWTPVQNDRWHDLAFDDIPTRLAIAQGPVLVTLGQQGAENLLQRNWPQKVIIRSTEKQPAHLAANIVWLQARPPYGTEQEIAFLSGHGISTILCRNSGGRTSYAKIEAARLLQLPVWMIRRPVYPGAFVTDTADVVDWLARLFPGRRI